MRVIYESKLVAFINGIRALFDLRPIAGMAIVEWILIYHTEASPALLAHERQHIRQWRRYWYIGFLPVYVFLWIRYGYQNHPLEREAREHATSYEI